MHIDQDERVSMGADGNLYFSNALQKDSRKDYCCFVAFNKIRIIVQKTAMAVMVTNCRSLQSSLCGLSHLLIMLSSRDRSKR